MVANATKLKYTKTVVYTINYTYPQGVGNLMKQNCEYIGRYISQMYRKGSSFVSKELNDLEIGSGQVMFLLELYRKDGRNQEELSDILNIDKGTTARAIKKLESNNFLIRVKDENDKRAYKVYLTQKSKDLEEEVYAVMMNWEDIISSKLTKDETRTMILLLRKMCTIK